MSLRSNPSEMRRYKREWMAARRREWFQGKSCVRCGSVDRLEIDHIDPSQKVHHAVWSWRKDRREAELAKCQVLCDPCHEQKTNDDRYAPREHGTPAMYKRGKCRCAACRKANTIYRRNLKMRRLGSAHA